MPPNPKDPILPPWVKYTKSLGIGAGGISIAIWVLYQLFICGCGC